MSVMDKESAHYVFACIDEQRTLPLKTWDELSQTIQNLMDRGFIKLDTVFVDKSHHLGVPNWACANIRLMRQWAQAKAIDHHITSFNLVLTDLGKRLDKLIALKWAPESMSVFCGALLDGDHLYASDHPTPFIVNLACLLIAYIETDIIISPMITRKLIDRRDIAFYNSEVLCGMTALYQGYLRKDELDGLEITKRRFKNASEFFFKTFTYVREQYLQGSLCDFVDTTKTRRTRLFNTIMKNDPDHYDLKHELPRLRQAQRLLVSAYGMSIVYTPVTLKTLKGTLTRVKGVCKDGSVSTRSRSARGPYISLPRHDHYMVVCERPLSGTCLKTTLIDFVGHGYLKLKKDPLRSLYQSL